MAQNKNPTSSIVPGIYKHYKGNLYRVIGVGRHGETYEQLVVYVALYDSAEFGNQALWVRPVKIWNEDVEWLGKIVKRFTLVEAEKKQKADKAAQ